MSKLLVRARTSWCLLLFLFVTGLWQTMHIIIHVYLPPEWLQHLIHIAIQIVYVSTFVWLIKREGSSFQEYGLWWPKNSEKYVSGSILLALAYFYITVFLPGSFVGFELLPATSQISLEIISVLLIGLASESVFRSYIQGNLTRAYGFLPALFISSLMFSLHKFPLTSLLASPIYVFTHILSLFFAGLFLGFFFHKTRTLVCPVTFHVVFLLNNLVPLQPTIAEHTTLFFEVAAYIIFIIFLQFFIKQKNARTDGFQPIASDRN